MSARKVVNSRKREKIQKQIIIVKSMTKNSIDFDCLKCEYINCFNLFKKSEDLSDAGQELYVLNLLGEKVENRIDIMSAYVCANGKFFNASCFLLGRLEEEKGYLLEILIQAVRDFKASIFLAFSGHYRQAMQILRCAFENIISGLYFQSDFVSLIEKKARKEDLIKLEKRFNEWKRQGRGDIRKSIEILRRIGFLNRDEEREYYKLYDLLSRFIHTPKEFNVYMKHKSGQNKLKREIICPASTYFDEGHLADWSNTFQEVFVVLLKSIATFYPNAFQTDSGEIAVKMIRGMINEFPDKILVSKKIGDILKDTNNQVQLEKREKGCEIHKEKL